MVSYRYDTSRLGPHRQPKITDWRTDFFDQGPTSRGYGGLFSDAVDITYRPGGTSSSGKNARFGWSDPRSNAFWNKYSAYKLDSSRDWKTHWKSTRRQSQWHNETSGSDPKSMGWQKGIHYTTGRERSIAIKHGSRRTIDAGVNLVEVLDYAAYNKDARYKRAAKDYGLKGGIKSMADILALEEYMSTGITAAKKKAQADADRKLKQTNQAIALNQQKISPIQHIDIGGQSIPISNIGQYIGNLQTSQQAALANLQSTNKQNIANIQSTNQAAIANLQSAHKTSISDLTNKLTQAQATASYGYGNNPQVQGVKTINELTPQGKRMGIKQTFGRKGQRLSSLNI